MRLGYHASHEQWPPRDLIEHVRLAEEAGFTAAMCSDHLSPWTHRQGNSAHAWSWLGAALEATRLSFGTVCAPGQRYHPVIVAQAIATLGAMYPGRFWVALGTGEHLNEHITGDPWPDRDGRRERLHECVDVIRRLLRGEEVTHHGLVEVDRARLFVHADTPPLLLAAALTEETAAIEASWADGLICAPATPEQAADLVRAYRSTGGRGPVVAQVVIAYDPEGPAGTEVIRREWPNAGLSPAQLSDLATVAEVEAACAALDDAALAECFVSTDLGHHAALWSDFQAAGIDTVYIHDVSRDQRAFLEAYREAGIPARFAAETERADTEGAIR